MRLYSSCMDNKSSDESSRPRVSCLKLAANPAVRTNHISARHMADLANHHLPVCCCCYTAAPPPWGAEKTSYYCHPVRRQSTESRAWDMSSSIKYFTSCMHVIGALQSPVAFATSISMSRSPSAAWLPQTSCVLHCQHALPGPLVLDGRMGPHRDAN